MIISSPWNIPKPQKAVEYAGNPKSWASPTVIIHFRLGSSITIWIILGTEMYGNPPYYQYIPLYSPPQNDFDDPEDGQIWVDVESRNTPSGRVRCSFGVAYCVD